MRIAAFMAGALMLRAQTAPPTELEAFVRIRQRMAYHLSHQPNYTCLETIERYVRNPAGPPKLVDTVRLEVALVDGREMFGWPGSRSFDDSDLTTMVTGGAVSTGDFGSHARALFTGRAANFHYRGQVNFQGREAIRVDYDVPQMLSGYEIRVDSAKARVAYHGSFYADASTFDMMRIEVIVDNPPLVLKLNSASDVIEYAIAHIAGGDFLLPSRSELSMIRLTGVENSNRVTFTNCREFTGESTLTFEDSSRAAPETAPAAPRAINLPKGMEIALELADPVDLGLAAIGDRVKARVVKEVKGKGGIVIPKGAIANGRLTHVERHSTYTVVGMMFREVDASGVQARMNGTLSRVSGLTQYRGRFVMPPRLPGEGIFAVPAWQHQLVRGCIMVWRS